jgi:hypothetical protein
MKKLIIECLPKLRKMSAGIRLLFYREETQLVGD